MEKPKYLYHGSSKYVEVLRPFQAYDWMDERGTQNAVFATSSEWEAYAFALGKVPDESGRCGRIIHPKYDEGKKMIFHMGHPNYGGKGYVYKLSSDNFIYAGGNQWVNPNEVVPVEIIEINVDDYLHLFRYTTDVERAEIEVEISKREINL